MLDDQGDLQDEQTRPCVRLHQKHERIVVSQGHLGFKKALYIKKLAGQRHEALVHMVCAEEFDQY